MAYTQISSVVVKLSLRTLPFLGVTGPQVSGIPFSPERPVLTVTQVTSSRVGRSIAELDVRAGQEPVEGLGPR